MAHEKNTPKTVYGIPASPGIVIGKAHVVDRSKVKVMYHYLISDDLVDQEVARFREAVEKAKEQLTTLKDRLPDYVKDHAFILESHRMILKDSMVYNATIKHITEDKINAEWALKKTLLDIKNVFQEIDDEYISNRISDVGNVVERILRNLSGKQQESLLDLKERVIIVAHDISPEDATELNTSKVMGFVSNVGAKTSHTAIIAQALGLPAVMGLGNITDIVEEGCLLIVDGNTGEVVIQPDDDAIIYYHERQIQRERYRSSIIRTSYLPAKTLDGYEIAVMANTEFAGETEAVKENGGAGIGLYRTEFLYLKSNGFPSEEELFNDYKQVAEKIAPDPVIIRTLDLGGDKFLSYSNKKEANPALGLRAIRLSLKNPQVFKVQIRAILRASAYGNVWLMFPMISGLSEIQAANRILTEVKKDLDDAGMDYKRDIRVGIMIEIPSAVAIADILAHQIDFFSIGTNDLIQYALAVDRTNEDVAYLYKPFHPAILRMIRQVITAAGKAGIEVSLCGAMAGEPCCVPILIGAGMKRLSVNIQSVPLIKKIIRSISLKDAESCFEDIMKLTTANQVEAYIKAFMKDLLPELGENAFI